MVIGRHMATLMLAGLLGATGAARAQWIPVYDTPQDLPPPAGAQPLTGPEVITTADGFDNFDLGVDSAEPHASVNPQNPLWFFNAFNINRTHRTTNGHDWTFLAPSFGTGAAMRGDPVTAYDSLGRLYYENMYSATSGGSILGCKVMTSTNNGANWSAAVTAIEGVDKNWIACDQTSGPFANYAYSTMTAEAGGAFTRSTDGGATWTPTAFFGEQQLPGMMVAVGPNVLGGNNVSGGCVYVVTNSGPTSNSAFTFHRSTDGGVSFFQRSALAVAGYVGTLNSIGRLVINNARTRPYPFIAADNSFGAYRGRLYLVYASNDPAGDGNKPDIFLQYSTDQGATWSSRVRVNDNPNPAATNEWFPAIWCDKETGRLYIKWYDMRNDPTNQRAWVYGTYTDDGGGTFAPNQKISNADMLYPNPACSPNTNCYRGDYDAVTSNGITSMSVWTDFRSGNYGSYAGYFPDFAMLVSPAADTLIVPDSTDVVVRVPAVKLYTRPVVFSASVSPAAPFSFNFPGGDSIKVFPDSVRLRVKTDGVAAGVYTVTITGAGPNGTPVHKRTVRITVQVRSIAVTAPGGGAGLSAGTVDTIRWSGSLAGSTVRVELSRDGGVTFPQVLFASAANDGAEAWTVSGPPTTAARIRVTSLDYPGVAGTGSDFTILQAGLDVQPGWSLVSVPTAAPDFRRTALFPHAVSPAFALTPTGYQARDSLVQGVGYWLKFDSAGVNLFDGIPTVEDTVPVPAGWSLLGSIGYPVGTDSIIQSPPGIILALFTYSPGGGYQADPPVILPGQAVWIKTSGAGEVILRRENPIEDGRWKIED